MDTNVQYSARSNGKRHTCSQYEEELCSLRSRLLYMGELIERMIADATTSFIRGDVDLARQAIAADADVNALEVEVDKDCLLILAKRQPLGCDLRMVALAIKMVTDLERIGDLAVNIGERVVALDDDPTFPMAADIECMAGVVQQMVHDSIEAFAQRDSTMAHSVFDGEDEVDGLYRKITEQLQGFMRRGTIGVQTGIHSGAVAKFLERIGDHATNLAEQVIFIVEGRDVRHAAH
jgi:phosphate transport system protein